MEKLFTYNDGLRRRFLTTYSLGDYSARTLAELFEKKIDADVASINDLDGNPIRLTFAPGAKATLEEELKTHRLRMSLLPPVCSMSCSSILFLALRSQSSGRCRHFGGIVSIQICGSNLIQGRPNSDIRLDCSHVSTVSRQWTCQNFVHSGTQQEINTAKLSLQDGQSIGTPKRWLRTQFCYCHWNHHARTFGTRTGFDITIVFAFFFSLAYTRPDIDNDSFPAFFLSLFLL